MTQGKRGSRPLDRTCLQCGTGFSVATPSVRKRFCSRSCAVKSHIRNDDSLNPNWRGGKTKHPLYDTYMDMLGRCRRVTHHAYPRYGGRGITVCDRWIADFWTFASDMGDRPTGHSIDRIDNDGPYSPENCRWATYKQQSANQRRRPPQHRDDTTGRFTAA